MRILNLSKWGTKKARRHPALQGLPILGSGTFCTVFDNGKTVLKLTCDDIQYGYSTDYCAPKGRHFPKLIKNHGVVGEQDELALYLFEVEKIQPIKRGRHAPTAAKTLQLLLEQSSFKYWETQCNMSRSGGHKSPVIRAKEISRITLEKCAESKKFSPGMRDALDLLSNFVANYGASIDMHRANFMLRGKTLVFNDPVCSPEILLSHRSRRSFV